MARRGDDSYLAARATRITGAPVSASRELRVAYQVLASAIRSRLPTRDPDGLWREVQPEVDDVQKQRSRLIRAASVGAIILGDGAMDVLRELERDEHAAHTAEQGVFEYYEARIEAVTKAAFALKAAARDDLHMAQVAKPVAT